jgi:hypothetical protein
VRIVLIVACVMACGQKGGTTTPDPPKADKFPDGPPLVTPGERMTYRVQLQGVELASYELAVGDVTDLVGKKAIVVQGHAKAVGLVKMVANIDDKFTSWIDVATGRPLRFTTDEYATKSEDIEHSLADVAGRTGNTLPIAFHLNDQPEQPEPQTVQLPEVWDYNSFLIALRAWEGGAGSKVTAEVLRSRFLWHVDMTIHGKDKIATQIAQLNTVPALRFDGHTYKLTRQGGKFPDSDERDFSVWISDDAGRVPLKIVTRTDYGDVTMEITDYQAGTGQPLRQ